MSITLDDDFDYTEGGHREADDDGPALRPGYVPLPPLENRGGTGGTGIDEGDPEPFLTLRDPSRSTIDWNRFIRPATPEEIKAYDEWEERRAKLGMEAVIEQVFADRRDAWEQTPEEAARRMWLGRQTGISQRMLQDPDVLRTAELRAQMGLDALTLHDAPEQVVSWLKTPGMLEIARDDLETLKKIGDALQRLAASRAPTRPGSKWKDFQSGIADVLEGKADVLEMQAAALMSPHAKEPEPFIGSSIFGMSRGFLSRLPQEVRKDVAAAMSRATLSNADEWRSWAEWIRPEPYVLPKEGTFSRWVSDVVRGTPYTLTSMPVSAALTAGGAALGGPAGATAGAALSSWIQTNSEAQTEQAQVWKQLVNQGMDPAEAYDKSFNEVYLPNFGLLYLSNFLQDRLTFGVPLGRGAAYWLRRVGSLLLSSLFEGGEEIGQSLISNRALGTENDWGQLLYEGAVGLGVGLVFGGGGTALDVAMGRYREHRSEARAAQESARIGAVMDEAVKAAEASRVRERSLEAFDDFVEYVGGQGQEKVNVDGAVFFQTFGEDAYAAAERLGIAEGLDEAARTGGAVEIPTAAILKNPDLYEKVKNDLRYSDDGMSRNEAQEYERTRDERNRADIDAAASARRTVQEAGEKAERIRDDLRAQFEALGHKKVGKREAEFYSTIWTAAIANEARYAGVDIEEMARRWNLRFQYDRGTGDVRMMQDVYTQPVNAGVDLGQKVPILDLSGKLEDAKKATPQELFAFLKAEFIGREPNISSDGEALIGIPSNSAARHVVRSSRKGLTYEDMDTRTAGLLSLREVLQNARLIESHKNQKDNKTHLKNVHRFYIPVWSSDGLKTLRIVAHERKSSDGRIPVEVDLNDVIIEGASRNPARLSGTPLSGVLPERPLRRVSEITIADMLRGVKDADGNLYVGEEYRQPLNPDVDLGAKVNVVKAQRTMQKVPFHERDKAFTPEMRAEIAERFQNGQVVNAHTGLTVTLSKKSGLRHILSTARNTYGESGDALYQAIPYLDQIVREAYRVESHDDRKPPAGKVEGAIGNLKQVHRFLAPIDFGGENDRHVMLLVTKEYETGKAEIEDISLYDMQHAKKMSGRPSQNGSVGTEQSWNTGAPDNISVRELVDAVNDAEGRPYLYDPVGEEYRQTRQLSLFGEDGEPTLGALPQQRHFLDRLSEKPVEQWSLDEIVAFEEFEDKFNTDKPSTWGASEEDTKRIKKLRAKEREMEDLDGYEFEDNAPSTWNGTDSETRQRASAIMAKGRDMTPQEYAELRKLQMAAEETYRRDFRRKHIDPDGLLDLYDPQKLEELLYKVSRKTEGEDLTLEDEVTSKGQFQHESPDGRDWVKYPIFIKKRKGERVFEVQDDTGRVYAEFDNEIRARYFARAAAQKLDEAREALRAADDFVPPSQAVLDAFDRNDPTTWGDEQLQSQGVELLQKENAADEAGDDSALEKYNGMFYRLVEDAEALLIDRVDREQEAHEDDLENNPFRGLDIATVIGGVDTEPYRQASTPSSVGEVYNQTAYNGSPRQSASGQQGPREDPGALLRRVWGGSLAYQTREDLEGTIAAINGGLTIDGFPDDGVGYFLTREALDRMGLERPNRVGYDENDPTTWPEGPRKEEAIKYRALLDETPLDGDEYEKIEAILDRLCDEEARDAEKEREIYSRLEEWYAGHLNAMKDDAEDRLRDMRLFGVNSLAELYDRMDEAEATPASEWSPELRAFMERFATVTKYYEPFLGRGPEDYAFYEAGNDPGETMEKPTRWRGVPELEELFLDLAEVEKNLAFDDDKEVQKGLRKEKAGIVKEAHAVLKRMHKELDALIDENEARQKALWAKAEEAGIKVEDDQAPETYYQRQAEEKLAQDEKKWAEAVDKVFSGAVNPREHVKVMTTPLVFHLAGEKILPLYMDAGKIARVVEEHGLTPNLLKQIPRALAEPIALFRSKTHPNDSLIVMTELRDDDGGTVAVPIRLDILQDSYQVNRIASVYGKKNEKTGEVKNEWFAEQFTTEQLRYLDTQKSSRWLDQVGLQLPEGTTYESLIQTIPTEADLVKARGENPGFYQDTGTPLGSTRFGEAETIVTILKDGNRSTFLHELGHVFLNSRRNLALMEGIDETVRQDWTKLVEWLEVADIDFSKPLSEADKKRWTNAHEKFAAGVEKYLMEGKAPSLELARAFRAFRKWLTDIYRAVRNVFYVDADGNRVEFEINDEIRGVMDRMLASEEEIAQATEARQLGEARRKLLEAGIPDDFVKEYEEAVWAATDASERQLFRILEGETSRDYRDRMKELRAQRTAEVREETAKVPRYRTAAFMKEKGIKLSLKDLTDRYGLAATQDLPKGTAHVGGLQLDVAAEMLGYENADLLVEDLKAVKEVPFNEAVRRAVDESMRREESLLYNPEALRDAVDEALHVDERLAEILRRRELVMEKLGRNPRDEATRRREGAATLAAVKEQAREIVQGKKIGVAASVRKWHAAELRSRSRALQSLDRARKALAEKDTPKASAALKDAREHLDMEALNHALVQEAMKARDEIEAGKRYARRLWKNRKRLEAAVGEENWAQVRGLMERFGFWRVENPEKSQRKAPLAEWADKLEVGGALLPDLVLQDGVGFDSPARMTFSQFSDLIQAVRTIEHVGRNERTLIIDGRRRERQALKERLIAEKVEHYGDLPPMDTDPNEGSGRLAGAKRLFLKYFSDLTAVEFMMRQMDKHKPLGSWWEAIFKPVSDAELREIEMKREMVSKVRKLFAKFPDTRAGLKEGVVTRLYNPRKNEYTAFTRENLLALALNMGTERNRQRVLGGWFPKLDMTDEQAVQEAMGIVDSLLENLTDTDWEFVQGVWDLFDGYWPQVAALEKEVSGVTPEKEKAVPVRTASGKVMRGGYFPIRYNPVKNLTAAKHQAEKLEKSLHETPYGRAAVAHGYTKGRTEVVNRQILFKLDTIAMHLNEVAHDLTHRMAVRDVSRLINDKELSAHLEHVLGRENYEQLNPWLQHLANSALSEKDVTAVDKIVRRGMSNIAAAYMGFKVSVGLKQIVGLGPAADQVGRLRLSKAMMQYLAAYDKEAIRDEIFAKSTYMSDRANNFDRDIRGALNERTASTFSNREAGVRNMMFWWAGYMDTLVSVPTWLAAYHKALNDFAKGTQDAAALEAKAVEYADMVVRTTQNAGSPKDLAAIQRGGAMRKLFTMFYTGIGRLYNLTREEWHKGHGIRDIPRLAGHVLTVYTIPFLVGELLMNRALGPGDDDDDSLLARLWWAGKGTLGEMMAPLVFVRDVANLFVSDYRYRATPLDEIGGSIERLVRMSRRAMDEDREMEWTKFARESTNAAGGLLGLPSRQIIATIRGIDNAIDKWDERGVWERLFGTPMDILMGPVKEKR